MSIEALVDEMAARIAARVLRDVRAVIREEVSAALAERERDAYLNARQAAAYAGRSVAAWGVYCRRHPDLLKMAIGSNRSRRWRRSDLEAWFQREGERAT